MDFQTEILKSLKAFPTIEGLIFVDPEGESILHEAPHIDPFFVQLAGAKLSLLMKTYPLMPETRGADFLELSFKDRYLFSIRLEQSYHLVAIGHGALDKSRLRAHLGDLAVRFNREIV